MVNPLVDNKFDLLAKMLHEPFLLCNPERDSVKALGVCREVDYIVASPFENKFGVIRSKSGLCERNSMFKCFIRFGLLSF